MLKLLITEHIFTKYIFKFNRKNIMNFYDNYNVYLILPSLYEF